MVSSLSNKWNINYFKNKLFINRIIHGEDCNHQFNEFICTECDNKKQLRISTLPSPKCYIEEEINKKHSKIIATRLRMRTERLQILGKNELKSWIDSIEKAASNVDKINRIDVMTIERLINDLKKCLFMNKKRKFEYGIVL